MVVVGVVGLKQEKAKRRCGVHRRAGRGTLPRDMLRPEPVCESTSNPKPLTPKPEPLNPKSLNPIPLPKSPKTLQP